LDETQALLMMNIALFPMQSRYRDALRYAAGRRMNLKNKITITRPTGTYSRQGVISSFIVIVLRVAHAAPAIDIGMRDRRGVFWINSTMTSRVHRISCKEQLLQVFKRVAVSVHSTFRDDI